MSGSTPTLNFLIASDQALTPEWTNHPYVGINNAFITIVNSNTNFMSNIYLTEQQALNQSYTITGLTNGDLYYVSYTQVQGTPDTAGVLSNTLSSTPCTVPLAPGLVSVVYIDGTTATATVTIPADTSGAAYENITFLLLDETIVPGVITQQSFPFTNQVYGTSFTLASLTVGHSYIISCQLVNSAGYSNLSNSINFLNSVGVPVTPVLNNVVSGMSTQSIAAVQFQFTPVQQPSSQAQLVSATFQYQLVSDVNWNSFGTYSLSGWLGGQITVLSSALTPVSPAAPPLVNGQNYRFRYFVTANSIASPYSSFLTGVPAVPNSFSAGTLTVNHDGTTKIATGLQSGWALAAGTFPAPTVTSTFSYFTGAIPGTAATAVVSKSASLSPCVLPVVGLTLGSSCSVSMLLQTVIPPANQPYWLNAPSNYIIAYSPTLSASSTVTTVPGPVTNITYISGETSSTVGAIQFFWDQPLNTGYEPITTYTLNLYNGYPSGQSALLGPLPTTGAVENYTFTNVPLSGAYWVTIAANNSVGSSTLVTYPDSLTGIYISTITVTTPVVTATQTSTTSVLIGYTVASPPAGIVYNTFDIYSIAPNGVQTKIATQNYSSGITAYSYTTAISSVPAAYLFGVIINATGGSPPHAVESLMGLASIQSAGAPIVGVPSFSTGTNGNGIVTVVINTNGSDIITNGAMIFVIPSAANISPVNILTTSQISAINSASQPYTLVYNLLYAITSAPGYLISMSNSSGSGYADGNLQ